jgi:hypothetical protein
MLTRFYYVNLDSQSMKPQYVTWRHKENYEFYKFIILAMMWFELPGHSLGGNEVTIVNHAIIHRWKRNLTSIIPR